MKCRNTSRVAILTCFWNASSLHKVCLGSFAVLRTENTREPSSGGWVRHELHVACVGWLGIFSHDVVFGSTPSQTAAVDFGSSQPPILLTIELHSRSISIRAVLIVNYDSSPYSPSHHITSHQQHPTVIKSSSF